MKSLPKFKRGDSLILSCRSYHMVGDVETGNDLTDVEIRSQIRLGKKLIAETTVTKADQVTHPGEFSLTVEPEVTRTFVATKYEMDIQQTLAGVVLSSDTFALPVELDVTYD